MGDRDGKNKDHKAADDKELETVEKRLPESAVVIHPVEVGSPCVFLPVRYTAPAISRELECLDQRVDDKCGVDEDRRRKERENENPSSALAHAEAIVSHRQGHERLVRYWIVAEHKTDGMRAIVRSQFVAYADPVRAHRVDRQAHQVRDLLVGVTLACQRDKLYHAPGQHIDRGVIWQPNVKQVAIGIGTTSQAVKADLDRSSTSFVRFVNNEIDRLSTTLFSGGFMNCHDCCPTLY